MKKVKAKKRQGTALAENRATAETVRTDPAEEGALLPKGKNKVKREVEGEESSEGLVSRVTGKVQWIGTAKEFLREVRIELKKVTWPTRKETVAATIMVIGLSVLVAIILGLLDVGLARLVALILGRP
jgi:preprotein translocase subunit SecE